MTLILKILSTCLALCGSIIYNCGWVMTQSHYPMSPRREWVPFWIWFLSGFLQIISGSFSFPPSVRATRIRWSRSRTQTNTRKKVKCFLLKVGLGRNVWERSMVEESGNWMLSWCAIEEVEQGRVWACGWQGWGLNVGWRHESWELNWWAMGRVKQGWA